MSGTVTDFKRVFLGKVSSNDLAAKKADVLAALTAVDTAVNTAANAGTPPATAALDKVRAQSTKLRAEANAARPPAENAKESWAAYDKIEKAAGKQLQGARALQSAAGKLASMKADMAKPGGIAALDKTVAKIGDAAKSTDDKATLIAAMQARYDLDLLAGDLSTKALPKLYKVFAMVPESHARLNAKLKVLERTKGNEESDYTGASDRIRINAGPVGKFSTLGDKDYESGTGKVLKLDHFTATTLHEIGHAVDEKKHYMDTHQGAPDHGAWVPSSADAVAAIAAERKGFATRFPNIPASTRKLIMEQFLIDGKVKSPTAEMNQTLLAPFDPNVFLSSVAMQGFEAEIQKLRLGGAADASSYGITQEKTKTLATFADAKQKQMANRVIEDMKRNMDDLAPAVARLGELKNASDNYPPATDHAAIQADPALAWLASVKLSSKSSGLWSGGKAEAAAAAVEGKVYQESYQGTWWSYALAARDKQVSNYQFRAPPEWYAESYAMFFLGKLAKDHPLYAGLNADKNAKPAKKAA